MIELARSAYSDPVPPAERWPGDSSITVTR